MKPSRPVPRSRNSLRNYVGIAGVLLCILAVVSLLRREPQLATVDIGRIPTDIVPPPNISPIQEGNVAKTAELSQNLRREALYAAPGVATLCLTHAGDGSSLQQALEVPSLHIWVLDTTFNAKTIVSTLKPGQASRVTLVPGGPLGVRALNASVTCDVTLIEGSASDIDESVFMDLVALVSCKNAVIVRIDVPATATPVTMHAPVWQRIAAAPVWRQMISANIIKEETCDASEGSVRTGGAAMECVGVFIVRSLPCAIATPSEHTAPLADLIARNSIQQIWATDKDFNYRWSIGVYAGEHVLDIDYRAADVHNPVLLPEHLWDQPSGEHIVLAYVMHVSLLLC